MMRQWRWFFAVVGFVWATEGGVSCAKQPLILMDDVQIQTLQTAGIFSPTQQSRDVLIQVADKALDQPALSVTDKTVLPPSNDLHDYASLSVYYWPNPDSSDGKPYVARDGKMNPEADDRERYDVLRLQQMILAVHRLAVGYALTQNEVYARKATELLSVWFLNVQTRMNPNLNFGQGVPGVTPGKPSGMIETRKFIDLIDAFSLLDASPLFAAIDKNLQNWFRQYLNWILLSTLGRSESRATNNLGVWYDAQTAVIARYVEREDVARTILEDTKWKRIAVQIDPDGRMPRELKRTKSQHYTSFNLQALIILARLGEQMNVNLWDYRTADGRGLKPALDFFMPYVLGKKEWDYPSLSSYNSAHMAFYFYVAGRHYGELW